MVCRCIDISHYQAYPNFADVKSAGVLAVIHKATEGTGYSDPNRATNLSRAKAEGLAIATYHFLKHGSIESQMEHYVETVQPVRGERMIIDHEDAACTLADLEDAIACLMEISGANDLDLQLTVYSGHLLKEQLGPSRNALLAENTDLWIAHYGVSQPTWPTGTYPIWTLWQYSDKGQVPGIDDNYVDMNNFNGSDENLVKWIGPAAPALPERPTRPGRPPRPPEVAEDGITIDIKANAPLVITVNGTRVF